MDNFRFDKETHSYYLNDERLAGVSSTLRYAGFNDMSFVNSDVLEKAQAFGMAVHLACEYLDKGTLERSSLDANLDPYLQGWIKFKNDFEVQIVCIEKLVYSAKWKCAGILDRVVNMAYGRGFEGSVLIDIKSTTTMNPATHLQTAAYKMMYEEMGAGKIKARLGVQLMPNNYKVIPYDDKTDERTFIACLTIRNWKKNRGIK